MKVPTYTAKLDRPRRGQGQFLTAQLSGSAMAAPARAFARSGQQLAQVGSDLAAFGMKKAQIGADAEAQAASLQLDIELQKMQQEFLANPNMQQAEQKYQDMARLKVETFKSGLSNRLARDAFRGRAAQVTLRNQTSFLKANNARVVEQRKVLLNNDTDDALTYATNPSNSPESRAEVANLGLENIDDAQRDLGPELHAKLRKDFYQRLAKGSLINAINKGLDAEETLEDFRTNKSADPVVSAARQNLSPSEVDKIYGEVKSSTDTARTLAERRQKRERKEATLNFDTTVKSMVEDVKVNANMADPNVATEFMTKTDDLMRQTLDSHEGSPESKAELSIQLKELRRKHSLDIGVLQQQARRDAAVRRVGEDLRALNSNVFDDPSMLSQAIQTLDQSISQTSAGFQTTEEEEDARAGGREDLIQSALDSYAAKGQINEMRELFNSPGIQASLTPGVQEDYRKRIAQYDRDESAKRREFKQNLALFEMAAGRPPTAKERIDMAGFAPKSGNVDPGASFRKEFNALSKRFVEIQDGYNRVKLAAEAGPNDRIAGDFAMIFNYMKMLDPGVVRESEFRTIAEAGGLPAQLQSGYNRIRGGKLLPDNIREQYSRQAKASYEKAVQKQQGLQNQYTDLAKKLGYDPEQVIIKYIGLGINDPSAEAADQTLQQTPAVPPVTDSAAKPIRIDARGVVIK